MAHISRTVIARDDLELLQMRVVLRQGAAEILDQFLAKLDSEQRPDV